LKKPLPFSNDIEKNRRFFNDKDYEIFKYLKEFGTVKTVSKY
jgi:hypothetical protein